MEQHSQVHILVNSTIREARQICKFNTKLPLGTMEIFKSCPGQSVQLKTELIPLTTLLTSYRLQLESKSDREQQTQNHNTALSLNNINKPRLTSRETNNKTPFIPTHHARGKRLETLAHNWKENNIAEAEVTHTKSRSKRAIDNLETQIINSLKPKLHNFITTGLASLAASAQRLFLGSPFAGAMLLIASNLVPLLI